MNHLYKSPDGKTHICEGGRINREIYLVWTKCEIDVPANKSFKGEELPSCEECLQA